MSLRKPYTLVPARLEANRRNAKKSTGPRTTRGKAQSRMNGLRDGERSHLYRDLMLTLLYAPPCAVEKTARAAMTPQQAANPLFIELVEMFRRVEIDISLEMRRLNSPRTP